MTEDEEFLYDLKSLDNQTWDMGVGPGGTHSLIHFQDGEVITEKRFDAEPLADDCAQSRIMTAGESWGEMRRIGSIPLVDLIPLMEMWGGELPLSVALDYFHRNPQYVRFDKALK